MCRVRLWIKVGTRWHPRLSVVDFPRIKLLKSSIRQNKLQNIPDSLWPSSNNLTTFRFFITSLSARIDSSMALLTRLAFSSLSSLSILSCSVSSGGGLRTSSRGSMGFRWRCFMTVGNKCCVPGRMIEVNSISFW